MPRIILLGGGSFIARAVAQAALERGVESLRLSHDAPLDALTASDCLVNFAISPPYRAGDTAPSADCDLKAAQVAAEAGAWFGMLSTRRVYDAAHRWNASEKQPALGDETPYGRNKARTEKAVCEALQDRAGIFRLSNVFGYEYDPEHRRRSFLATLLTTLKRENRIVFDMHPDTRRDFISVEGCANLLLDRILDRTTGIYNLGSGAPLRCGDLADWIMDGYGQGRLESGDHPVHDEFFLDMSKWNGAFGPVAGFDLQSYCTFLGRKLRDA